MTFNKISMALAAALFLSLSVNFFLAGLMLGNAVSPAPVATATEEIKTQMTPDEARRAEWQKRDEALRAALSPADREIVQAHTEANKQVFEDLKSRLETARDSVAAAMTADPFDQAALDTAIEAETDVKALFMREMYRARRAVTEELSPEGRKIFQEMNPLRRRGGHHRTGHSDDRAGGDRDGDDARARPPLRDGADLKRGDMPPREHFKERRERIEKMRDMRHAPPPPGSLKPEDAAPPSATDMPDTPPPAVPEPSTTP